MFCSKASPNKSNIFVKRGEAKSGFLDKGVPVTQSPMDQMT